MNYKAVKGSMINDDQAQKYGERLEALSEELSGNLTPDDVVSDARTKKSPLHEFFEWDDSEAGKKYRIHQARLLLCSINVVYNETEEIRAFHNVTVTKDKETNRFYTPLVNVLSDAELRRQVIENALKELKGWQKKYRQYAELSPLFSVIENFEAQNEPA